MVKQFLSDPATIPFLLNLISFKLDPLLTQEAAEILALLIEACQHPQFQMYQGLQYLIIINGHKAKICLDIHFRLTFG